MIILGKKRVNKGRKVREYGAMLKSERLIKSKLWEKRDFNLG